MDFKNNTITQKSKADMEVLAGNSNVINTFMEKSLVLLELNRLPNIKLALNLVEKDKIRLIYEESIKFANARYVMEKNILYVNATPFCKRKDGIGEVEYIMDSKELYSLLMGALVVYYNDILVKNRDYVNDCITLYINMLPSIFVKGGKGHFASQYDAYKFHFLAIVYLLSNNKTVVTQIKDYAIKISKVSREIADVLDEKYNLDNFKNYYFGDFLNDVLKEEFPFIDKFTLDSVLYNAALIYGPANVYFVDVISVMGTIIVDYTQGNKPHLNLKYAALKDLVKSNMYNNINSILSDI